MQMNFKLVKLSASPLFQKAWLSDIIPSPILFPLNLLNYYCNLKPQNPLYFPISIHLTTPSIVLANSHVSQRSQGK